MTILTSENTPWDYEIFKVVMTVAVPKFCDEHAHLVEASGWITLDGDAIMLGLTEEKIKLS